jgi:hypothetical protein
MSRMPHEFSSEELLDLMDIATNALEEISNGVKRPEDTASSALEEIGKQTTKLMEQ